MKKYICTNECQLATERGIELIAPGSVQMLEKPHPCFRLAGTVDFNVAGEEELMEGDFELSDLRDYIKKTYGEKVGNLGLERSVKKLLDCRFRETPVTQGTLNAAVEKLKQENAELTKENESLKAVIAAATGDEATGD